MVAGADAADARTDRVPRTLSLIGGALVAATLATTTPAPTIIAAIAAEHQPLQSRALFMEVILVAWALPAGAWIVGVRFSGRRWLDAVCIPLLGLLVLVSGGVWSVRESRDAGSMLPEALLTFGAISLGLAALALVLAAVVWGIVRSMSKQLVAIASAGGPLAGARVARRVGMWLLATSSAHTVIKGIGGPLVFGIVGAAAGAIFLTLAARWGEGAKRRWIAAAVFVALVASGLQACWTSI